MSSDELTFEVGPIAVAVEKLVSRVQAGETTAFRELFDTYRGLVYRMGCRLLGNQADAADLTQEVFLTVYRRIHTLRNCAALRAWICRITVTRAHNRQRLWKRRQRHNHISLDREGLDCQPTLELHCTARTPEQACLSKEVEEQLTRALESVTFQYRAAVIMRDIEGLSYAEIAVSLGVRVGTVKSRIARGRDELRRALAGVA